MPMRSPRGQDAGPDPVHAVAAGQLAETVRIEGVEADVDAAYRPASNRGRA